MVAEAQSHSEDDKKQRETVDLRNQTDNTAYSLEKLLQDNREKIAEDQAKDIEEAVASARKAAEGSDPEAIRSALDRLTALSHKVAETLYKSSEPPPQEPPSGGAPTGETGSESENVVDAEYTVKD